MTRLLLIGLLCISSLATAQSMNTAKTESDNLLNAAVPFAEKMLTQHGEFYPYGAALTPSNQVVSVAATPGGERPPSAEVIKLLNAAFRQGAKDGKYKATALVYDAMVQLPESHAKSDAIAVSLNHKDGYSVVVYLPYSRSGSGLSFGHVFAVSGASDVFAK
jgi:hypothetical protein